MTQKLATAPIKTILKRPDHQPFAGTDQYIRWYNQERISLVA